MVNKVAYCFGQSERTFFAPSFVKSKQKTKQKNAEPEPSTDSSTCIRSGWPIVINVVGPVAAKAGHRRLSLAFNLEHWMVDTHTWYLNRDSFLKKKEKKKPGYLVQYKQVGQDFGALQFFWIIPATWCPKFCLQGRSSFRLSIWIALTWEHRVVWILPGFDCRLTARVRRFDRCVRWSLVFFRVFPCLLFFIPPPFSGKRCSGA